MRQECSKQPCAGNAHPVKLITAPPRVLLRSCRRDSSVEESVPDRRRGYIWARLTKRQILAVLAAAAEVDRNPTSLSRVLPDVGQRASFRSAVDKLRLLVPPSEYGEVDR